MAEKKKKQSLAAGVFDLVEIVVQALVIIFLIFTFCFRISGVVVSNFKYQPEQGDIVVITQPTAANEPLIKRVIATEGQVIDIDFETGVVKVDGEVLQEDYIAAPTYRSFDVSFPHTVKEGCVFCMGDNRNESWDCRDSGIGDIDVRYIIGEAQFRLIPFGKFKIG